MFDPQYKNAMSAELNSRYDFITDLGDELFEPCDADMLGDPIDEVDIPRERIEYPLYVTMFIPYESPISEED